MGKQFDPSKSHQKLAANEMLSTILIYSLVILFISLIITFWGLNFIGLPGNWLMVVTSALWLWLGPESFRFSWYVILGLIVLALTGELFEFLASVFGTKKMGGSSRGATLSVVGSIVGGLLGVFVGIPIPIPIIGMMISGILFASLGAMAGAVLGEYTLGTPMNQTAKIGGAAFLGRMLGTFGKIIMGAAIVAVVLIAPFVFQTNYQ